MNVATADFTLLYNNKNITTDIAQYVIGVTYTDKLTGESDELEITLEDSDGRWQSSWYPNKKAQLQLTIRQDGQQLNCGTFEIDELNSTASVDGDVFMIKALAAGISKGMRTLKTYAHEDKSLREIANTVAGNLGLTLSGIVQNITIHRQHQYRETDLSFLNRIGDEYGYIFSVRGNLLVFTYYQDLQTRSASLSLVKKQLVSYDLKDTSVKTFKSARNRHHNPLSKEDIEYAESLPDEDSDDELEMHARVENKQQAEAKTKYKLFKENTKGVGGDISCPGTLLLLSGNNITLPDLGMFSGTYHVLEASHSISRDGAYTSAANIKRVSK